MSGPDATPTTEQSSLSQQLAFDREKWLGEIELRRREVEFKALEQERLQAELKFKIDEAKRSRWSSPLVLAILGAGLATLGNAGVTWLTGRDQRRLEDARASSTQHIQDEANKAQIALESFKAESGRLLEVIKTNDPDKAAVNLQFLLDAGLISNEQTVRYLKNYLATRSSGQGPALPSISQQSTVSRPSNLSSDELRQLLKSGFTLGVDLSHFNGNVDFAQLRKRGVEFAYLRASQGASSVDRSLESNAAKAREAGVRIGLYHVLVPDSDIGGQFANFAARLSSTTWSLPPAIDVSDAPNSRFASIELFGQEVEDFAGLVESKFGMKPIIYSGIFFKQYLTPRLSKYSLWIADYKHGPAPRLPDQWPDYAFWQVADGVSDDPLLSSYDINVFKGDIDRLDRLAPPRESRP